MSKLLWLGIAVLLTGFALLVAGSVGQGTVSTGGVVFIGPFPLAFGSGPEGWQLALVSVVIGGAMLALLLLWGWKLARTRQGQLNILGGGKEVEAITYKIRGAKVEISPSSSQG